MGKLFEILKNSFTEQSSSTDIDPEVLMVKSITTEDMLQFKDMPYDMNCPVLKFIKKGGHPFAYMDLTSKNKDIVREELKKVNSVLRESARVFGISRAPQIPIPKVCLEEYSNLYGYTRIMCHPYTPTRKIAKYPVSLFFCTRLDNFNSSTHGNIFYGKNGNVLKGEIYFSKKVDIQAVSLKNVNGNLTAFF